MPVSRAEVTTSRVPWATSPPQTPRHHMAASLKHRNSIAKERHFTHASIEHIGDASQTSHQASPTIESESSVSNQWFSFFTKRLLYRNQRPPSFKQSLQPQCTDHLPEAMF